MRFGSRGDGSNGLSRDAESWTCEDVLVGRERKGSPLSTFAEDLQNTKKGSNQRPKTR